MENKVKDSSSADNGNFAFIARLLEIETGSSKLLLDFILKEAMTITNSKAVCLFDYNKQINRLVINSTVGYGKGDLYLLQEQAVTEYINSEKLIDSLRKNRTEIANEYGIKQGLSSEHIIKTILPDRLCFVPVLMNKVPEAAIILTNKMHDYNSEEAELTKSMLGISWRLYSIYRKLDDLNSLKLKAENNERLKNSFMINVAHEIKTPVNAIVGFSNLIAEPGITNEARKKFLDIIINSSDELLTITSDFNEISNLENNLSISVKQEANLAELLTGLGDIFIPKARVKNLKFSLKIALDETDLVILTDIEKLKRIISSLAGNAIKFTYNGEIELSCMRKNGFIEFTVSDTGIGMSAQAKQKVYSSFSPEYQLLDKRPDGRGIGLALSYAYIRHLGGDIWFTSAEGEGSVFNFTIPFERSAEIKPDEKSEFKHEDTGKDSKKIILIAEDDDNNYPLIENIFLKQKLRVLRAVNGKEAVRICKSQHVDIVFMDIKMPEMDGYAATKLILESKPDMKIIAQTAYFGDRDKALSNGCVDFIAKPFSKQQLVALINKHL